MWFGKNIDGVAPKTGMKKHHRRIPILPHAGTPPVKSATYVTGPSVCFISGVHQKQYSKYLMPLIYHHENIFHYVLLGLLV